MTLVRRKYNPTSPEAISYILLKLPSSIPQEAAKIEKLREDIALQVQGEAVEVAEKYSVPLLMIAFDVAHKVSPEMVLRLNCGKRVLLFDHWGMPIIRDEDIYSINNIKEYKEHNNSKKIVPELIINLEDIWKKARVIENKDELETIKGTLDEIEKLIKPSMVTTFLGKAPALLFLLTQHLLYGKTAEIWYQENQSSSPIKITTGL